MIVLFSRLNGILVVAALLSGVFFVDGCSFYRRYMFVVCFLVENSLRNKRTVAKDMASYEKYLIASFCCDQNFLRIKQLFEFDVFKFR